MNQRIQELADLARDSIPKGRLTVQEWIAAYNQELARLVIEAALKVCDQVLEESESGRDAGAGVEQVREGLEQLFGYSRL